MGEAICKEGGGCSFPGGTGEHPLGLQGGRTQGSGENAARTWSPSPQLWWPKLYRGPGICAEVATAWETGEFVEIKSDGKDSPRKDTVSKGSLVQPLPFVLLDLVTEGCSVLSDFLKLKHILVFLGNFTLWKRFRQSHLRALVYWVWLGWS